MKKIKKILCILIVLSIFINTITANAATNITVNVVTNPKIDIMLASKETNVDLTNFEADIRNRLQQKGINTSNINFITAVTKTEGTSSDDVNVDSVINNWRTHGARTWSSTNGQIYSYNTSNCSGFTALISPTADVDNVSIDATRVHAGTLNNGIAFNVTVNANGSLNGYFLSLSNHANNYLALYKFNNVVMSGWAVGVSEILWCNPTQIDNSNAYGYRYTVGQKVLINYNYSAGSYGSFSCLSYWEQDPGNNAKIHVDCKDGKIQVYANGTKIMDVKDSTYTHGSYGFWGNNCEQMDYMYLKDISFSTSYLAYKTYKEILTQPTWREDAKRIVVNVDDTIDNTLTGDTTIGEILSRTLADDIHFIQWGTNTNKSASETFINRNDNKGKFTYNTNYSQAVEDTANYIVNLISQQTSTQRVIVGQDTSLVVNPSEYKTGAVSNSFPNGRWKVHHNYTYYDNNLGQSVQTEIYTPDLICNFDKPGEYIIYFDNQEVKKVEAHRMPVANFNIAISGTTLTLTNTSYDLDKNTNNGYGKGIASEKWYYKEATASSWTNGKLSTFNKDKIYIIKLEVTDMQGATSYTTKYVGTGSPVASFDYTSNIISKYKKLEIKNTSYDPEGYSITGYTWILKKDGVTKKTYTTATPELNFNQDGLGLGNYSYTLVVTNNKGTKSEAFTKNFTVIDDTDKPEVIANPTSCTWKSSQVVSLIFSDADSGFKNWRYCSTTSQTAPASTDTIWSSWNTNANSTATVTGTTTGEYYLHLQAYDNAGNLLERSIGLYQIDKTKPVVVKMTSAKGSINQNKITVTATDDHSGMYSYAISTTATQPSTFQSSNVLTATQLGTHYIWVKDNAGNVNSTTYSVTEMDFSITTNCGTQGVISNYSIIRSHQSTSVVIIPADGFKIKDVIVDGISVGAKSTYDFWDVTTSHTVSATFERDTKITTTLNSLKTKYDWISF